LKKEVERVKIDLSTLLETEIIVPYITLVDGNPVSF
jgi:hypothetical protein